MVFSVWRSVTVSNGRCSIWACRGTLAVEWDEDSRNNGLNTKLKDAAPWGMPLWRVSMFQKVDVSTFLGYPDGWPSMDHDYSVAAYIVDNGYRSWRVTLWPFVLILIAAGAWVLSSGRHAAKLAMASHCAACGYNLAGLDGASACPECGKALVLSAP